VSGVGRVDLAFAEVITSGNWTTWPRLVDRGEARPSESAFSAGEVRPVAGSVSRMLRRHVWIASGVLVTSTFLAGCIATTDLGDHTEHVSPTTAPSAPAALTPSITEPSTTIDSDYAVPDPVGDELSRVTFMMNGPDGVSEGESVVSAIAEVGKTYAIDFDCSPSAARVTIEWKAAPAVGEEAALPIGATSVTQDCGAPGRIEGIEYDADTLVQLTMFADELNAGWAVLLPTS
jgi:hypothetical protein